MNERDMNRDDVVKTPYTDRLGLPNGMTMMWGSPTVGTSAKSKKCPRRSARAVRSMS